MNKKTIEIYEQNKSIRILIPIFSFGISGGTRVITNLANEWQKMGHEIVLVSYYLNPIPYYPLNCKLINIDKKGNEIDRDDFATDNPNWFTNFKSLFNYVKKHSMKYDIAVATYNPTAYILALASKAKNYYYIQAYEPEFFSGGIKNILLKIFAWTTYFLPIIKVVNADIYKHYKNIRAEHVVPPGLDLELYNPKKTTAENKAVLTVGCIGRMEEWKGAHDVGDAVKILHNKGYLDSIKLKVAFNPIRYDNYELVQPHGDKNLADFYRSLDVLIAPGHIQLGAIHYPVIEAMACNVPVITTGYFPADNKNSFIVPIKSPDAIAKIIENIYLDYSIAYDKAKIAYNNIGCFSWDNVSKEFIKIFISAK